MVGSTQEEILEEAADFHNVPAGAYDIRASGRTASRSTTANTDVVIRTGEPRIDIRVKPDAGNESIHIPVVVGASGLKGTVCNDFFIGEDSDMVIMTSCGIHDYGDQDLEHDGIHRSFVGRNAEAKYVERHYGEGNGSGKRILNPSTEAYMEKNSCMEMETARIGGVDSINGTNPAGLTAGTKLIVRERLLTHGNQNTGDAYIVNLNGEGSSADVVSRSVAEDTSKQTFNPKIVGNARCSGHTKYDAITIDGAKILVTPGLIANNIDVALVHEAAIDKIAGEQIVKLMTLCLTEKEAEVQIVNDFLKWYIEQLNMGKVAAVQQAAVCICTDVHDTGGM